MSSVTTDTGESNNRARSSFDLVDYYYQEDECRASAESTPVEPAPLPEPEHHNLPTTMLQLLGYGFLGLIMGGMYVYTAQVREAWYQKNL